MTSIEEILMKAELAERENSFHSLSSKVDLSSDPFDTNPNTVNTSSYGHLEPFLNYFREQLGMIFDPNLERVVRSGQKIHPDDEINNNIISGLRAYFQKRELFQGEIISEYEDELERRKAAISNENQAALMNADNDYKRILANLRKRDAEFKKLAQGAYGETRISAESIEAELQKGVASAMTLAYLQLEHTIEKAEAEGQLDVLDPKLIEAYTAVNDNYSNIFEVMEEFKNISAEASDRYLRKLDYEENSSRQSSSNSNQQNNTRSSNDLNLSILNAAEAYYGL